MVESFTEGAEEAGDVLQMFKGDSSHREEEPGGKRGGACLN